MRLLITFFLFVLFSVNSADARRHHPVPAASEAVAGPWALFGPPEAAPTRQRGRHRASQGVSGAVVAHPAGCPRRAFCGCGASVRVFGHSVRGLWLAASWLRFPRAAPASGMVAARRGHVFVLEHHISGNTWMVYDANSGRGATRIHPRSLAGYTVVNPRA